MYLEMNIQVIIVVNLIVDTSLALPIAVHVMPPRERCPWHCVDTTQSLRAIYEAIVHKRVFCDCEKLIIRLVRRSYASQKRIPHS